AEELAAVRRVEGERRERVDDAVAAHVAAVRGLDADDAEDDLLGHSELRARALERRGVPGPELNARLDALRVDEDRAVALPGAARFRREGHGLQHRGLRLHAAEDRLEVLLREAVLLRHDRDELPHVLALGVRLRRARGRLRRGEGERGDEDEAAQAAHALNPRTRLRSSSRRSTSARGP